MKNTTPAYTKWITLPFGDEKLFTRTSAEPEPLPFEEIHEEGNHTVRPPSSSADSMQFSGYFEIPKGADDHCVTTNLDKFQVKGRGCVSLRARVWASAKIWPLGKIDYNHEWQDQYCTPWIQLLQ